MSVSLSLFATGVLALATGVSALNDRSVPVIQKSSVGAISLVPTIQSNLEQNYIDISYYRIDHDSFVQTCNIYAVTQSDNYFKVSYDYGQTYTKLYNNKISQNSIFDLNSLASSFINLGYCECSDYSDLYLSDTFGFSNSTLFYFNNNGQMVDTLYGSKSYSYGGFYGDNYVLLDNVLRNSDFCIVKCEQLIEWRYLTNTYTGDSFRQTFTRVITNPLKSFVDSRFLRVIDTYKVISSYTEGFITDMPIYMYDDLDYHIFGSLSYFDFIFDRGSYYGGYFSMGDLVQESSVDFNAFELDKSLYYLPSNIYNYLSYYSTENVFRNAYYSKSMSDFGTAGYLFTVPLISGLDMSMIGFINSDIGDSNPIVSDGDLLLQMFNQSNSDYTSGYNNGYRVGYQTGYNEGYSIGDSNGYNRGYDTGYRVGYNNGVEVNGNASFMGLFGGIADTPILMLRSLFDFDLFGVSVLTAVLSLITGVIVVHVIRKFI